MKKKESVVEPRAKRLAELLGVVSGKWKVQIVCHLLSGKKRFSELRRLLPGISRGMLSYELRQMQADDIVERTQYETIPPTVEYDLTAKGSALKPVLVALHEWGEGQRLPRTHSPLNK